MATSEQPPTFQVQMKLGTALALGATASLMVAGCGGAPNPTASPTELAAPTASATAEQTAVATASPTPGPTPIAYPGPPIPAGTITIEIAAIPHNLFDRSELTAPATTPFVIAFDNRDVCADDACRQLAGGTGLQHNVAIRLGADLIFNPLPTIAGPATADYFIPEGLSAGTYTFLCTVHPVMHGTLTIT